MTRVRVALLSAAALGTALLVSACGAGQLAQTARMEPAVPGANSTVAPGADNSIQLRNVMLAYPGVDGYRQGATAPLLLSIFNIGRNPVSLVRVETDAAATVTLQGGPVASGSASPSPGATAAHPGNPPAKPSASPSDSPSPSPSPSPSESAPASPSGSPSGSPSQGVSPGAGGGGQPVNLTVPVGGFVTLSPSAGATLQLQDLTRAIRSGQTVTMTFVFNNGAQYRLDVPVGLPSAPAPRGSTIPGVRGGEPGGVGVGGE